MAQIRQLSAQSLTSRVAARIMGNVTYVDGTRSVFVQDSTGGVLVTNPNLPVELQVGQRIEVSGEVSRGQYRPEMIGSNIRLITKAAGTVSPVIVSGDDLKSSRLQYQLVELQGLVRSAKAAHETRARAELKLVAYGQELQVTIRDIGADDYRRLSGARRQGAR